MHEGMHVMSRANETYLEPGEVSRKARYSLIQPLIASNKSKSPAPMSNSRKNAYKVTGNKKRVREGGAGFLTTYILQFSV